MAESTGSRVSYCQIDGLKGRGLGEGNQYMGDHKDDYGSTSSVSHPACANQWVNGYLHLCLVDI